MKFFDAIVQFFRFQARGQSYKTEPSFNAVSFEVIQKTSNESLLSPEYFFIDPSPPRTGWGPQIYNADGELVWHGPPTMHSQDFHVCDYLGQLSRHLCFHSHHPESKMVVLNDHYEDIKAEYSKGIQENPPNGHEFRMVAKGQSFLQPIQVEKPMDLRPYIGQKGIVSDCCFQEIETSTKSSLFDWCYLDYLPLWATSLFIETESNSNETSPKAGRGTKDKPWDFCHINSIDKWNEDYLISARHLDQLIKIAGPHNHHGVAPGTVLWKLGGKQNDFDMDFSFTRQHDARFISVNTSTTVLSLLNNAWEGTNEPSAPASAGQIVRINNVTMEASLLQHFEHPYGNLSSGRGNMQHLPNGNILIGWGRLPEITEYDQSGSVLFHARLVTSFNSNESVFEEGKGPFSYRTYKFPWIGKPRWKPKVRAKSDLFRLSRVIISVSWNGSTEVAKWRIFWARKKGRKEAQGGVFAKQGFESTIHIRNPLGNDAKDALPLVTVEALDGNGVVIAMAFADPYMATRLSLLILLLVVIETSRSYLEFLLERLLP